MPCTTPAAATPVSSTPALDQGTIWTNWLGKASEICTTVKPCRFHTKHVSTLSVKERCVRGDRVLKARKWVSLMPREPQWLYIFSLAFLPAPVSLHPFLIVINRLCPVFSLLLACSLLLTALLCPVSSLQFFQVWISWVCLLILNSKIRFLGKPRMPHLLFSQSPWPRVVTGQ